MTPLRPYNATPSCLTRHWRSGGSRQAQRSRLPRSGGGPEPRPAFPDLAGRGTDIRGVRRQGGRRGARLAGAWGCARGTGSPSWPTTRPGSCMHGSDWRSSVRSWSRSTPGSSWTRRVIWSALQAVAALVDPDHAGLFTIDPGGTCPHCGHCAPSVGRRRLRRLSPSHGTGRDCRGPARSRPDGRRRHLAHLHLGHDRPTQGRHADASQLRADRPGIPVLDGHGQGRPGVRVPAVVPHQLAGLHARWARSARRARSSSRRGSAPAGSGPRCAGTGSMSSTTSARWPSS